MTQKKRNEQTDNRRELVSIVPFGMNHRHPRAYRAMLGSLWENRDNFAYAYRILRDGCCDGCALGTSGVHDWTMDSIHLCMVRLELLRLNTMPAMDWRLLEDVSSLRRMSGRKLRKLGRLSVPMVRRKGDNGFRRISWDEAIELTASQLRAVDPHRLGWYLTSRGLTNEAYYAHQKVARFFGTNNVDTSARICHAPSTAALSATIGCAATTCSYSDWIGSDLVIFVGSNIANNQPVATKYLYYAKQAGTKVFVVNPYFEPGLDRYWVPSVTKSALFGTRLADDYFQVHIGGDIAFFYGVLKHLIENDWVDREFIAARTVGWQDAEAKARSLSWEDLERSAGQTQGGDVPLRRGLRQGPPRHHRLEHGDYPAQLRKRQCSLDCESSTRARKRGPAAYRIDAGPWPQRRPGRRGDGWHARRICDGCRRPPRKMPNGLRNPSSGALSRPHGKESPPRK